MYSHTKLEVLFEDDIVEKGCDVKTICLDQTMMKIKAQ